MRIRYYVLLAMLGFALAWGIAQFERFPGYLDSDYYFAGGLQIAQGKGFSEPYLWNYLDDPRGLPHPSHSYWMPLSSLIAAAGLWLTRSTSYQAGRLGFLVLAAIVPVVTASLAYTFSRRTDLSLISGLLAVFSVYYAPFMPVTDNYGPYLTLGALYFLIVSWKKPGVYVGLGAVSGLLTLARSDGLLWLVLTLMIVAGRALEHRHWSKGLVGVALSLAGFVLVAGAWFWHTYSVYGTWLAPGGGHLLWLKNYDQTFAYPASQLTFQSWLAQGWQPIVAARLAALRWNLLNVFAAQGEIFLLPFILLGIWIYRKDERVRIALLGWLGLLLVMTVVFPFAGSRGGFFHSGAAIQPVWWAMAPVGLDAAVAAARRRRLFTPQAFTIFQGALVGLVILMTGVILSLRVLRGWGEGEQQYPQVESFLLSHGAEPQDVVMVRNPPGYYLMTGRSAIVVPYADESGMAAVAARYGASYLAIEEAGAAGPIKSVYDSTATQNFRLLGEVDGTHIYEFAP